MWVRVGLCTLLLLVLGSAAGPAPGASAGATVTGCFVRYPSDRATDTRCTGEWRRLGHRYTGALHGVPVGTDWPAIPPAPRADGWTQVTVPPGERTRPVVALAGLASVAPAWVWTVRVLLAVTAAAWLALIAQLVATRRRPVAARPA